MHLSHLYIDFSVTAATSEFDSTVLGLAEEPSPNLSVSTSASFPFLVSLVLSRATLPPILRPNMSSILCSLKSLKLRDCANSLLLLGSLSRSAGKVHLQAFEFCCVNSTFDSDPQHTLSPMMDFLVSFRGLKHLHLKLSNFIDSSRMQAVLEHHRSTLKTLAYHEQQITRLHAESPWWESRDYSPSWAVSLPKVTKLHQLTALAFCSSPSVLVSIPLYKH